MFRVNETPKGAAKHKKFKLRRLESSQKSAKKQKNVSMFSRFSVFAVFAFSVFTYNVTCFYSSIYISNITCNTVKQLTRFWTFTFASPGNRVHFIHSTLRGNLQV